MRYDGSQHPAFYLFARAPSHLLIDDGAANIHQTPVLNAGRTRCLTRAARQTAVEVKLRPFRRGSAFEDLLHEVNAAARSVEFISKQLVSRAGSGTKSAVHALAQDRISLAAGGCVPDEVSEIRFH
jgi:hypothetical protein